VLRDLPYGHRTPESCLENPGGLGAEPPGPQISCTAGLLLSSVRLLEASVGVGSPRRPSIRAGLATGQSLATAFAQRRALEAWVGAHPSGTRFPKGTPGTVTAAPSRLDAYDLRPSVSRLSLRGTVGSGFPQRSAHTLIGSFLLLYFLVFQSSTSAPAGATSTSR
jgi:hypothetical protein